MRKSLKDYLDWNPGDEVLEKRTMGKHSMALMERIRKVESKACLSTSFTNGINLDLMDLKAKGKLTRIDRTRPPERW